jgi:hypothetical protein
MGLFDALTGGAAKVFVEVGEMERGKAGQVAVRCQSTGGEVKYDRIYLQIQGVERVEVLDSDLVQDYDGDVRRREELVHASRTTYNDEINVAPAGVLGANESAEWTVEITIPETANGEYSGQLASHHYQLFAGMDCFGNDPDSGWVQFIVW